MKFSLEIPQELQHLKKDDRGYPIPWFVPWVDGKPEFRFLDVNKRNYCIDQKLCPICGEKLLKGIMYFISGPIGFKNRVSTDTGMHELCAKFSIRACPHLFYREADRRRMAVDPNAEKVTEPPYAVVAKPTEVMFIKASGFKEIKNAPDRLIRYDVISAQCFKYDENGRLDLTELK